jgi:DNA-binding NtrC family response regulator
MRRSTCSWPTRGPRVQHGRATAPSSSSADRPAITRVQELIRRGAPLEGGALITAEPGAASKRSPASCTSAAGLVSPYVAIDLRRRRPGGVDRLLFGEPPPIVPTDLESVAADSCIAAARGGTLFLHNVTELRALRAGAAGAHRARRRSAHRRRAGRHRDSPRRQRAPDVDADVPRPSLRGDLYRRLSTVRIDLPPLRDRPDDVPALAQRLLDDRCAVDGRQRSFTQARARARRRADVGPATWRSCATPSIASSPTGRDDVIQIEHLLPALQLHRVPKTFVPSGSLRDARQRFERDYIASVLQHHDWRMAAAARGAGHPTS